VLNIIYREKEDLLKNYNSNVKRLKVTQNKKLEILEKYKTLENGKKSLHSSSQHAVLHDTHNLLSPEGLQNDEIYMTEAIYNL